MTTLSNRGYPMIREFVNRGEGHVMKIEEAQQYDQRPFRSMLIRGWIRFDRQRKGFVITKAGKDSWREFNATGIARKDPSLPLTAYFDPTAYGLRMPKRKRHTKDLAA